MKATRPLSVTRDDAEGVGCPTCNVPSGAVCRTPLTAFSKQPHKARYEQARAALAHDDDDHEADPETHDITGPTSAEVLADVVGAIIAYETGGLGEDATITLFQHLVDTGLAWSLQGSYGRAAQALIDQGLVTN